MRDILFVIARFRHKIILNIAVCVCVCDREGGGGSSPIFGTDKNYLKNCEINFFVQVNFWTTELSRALCTKN